MSNNRSAFEAIPGKDALVEYQPKFYPAKTYVEKDGLVYKSLTATSNTFLTPQWELIADLREVRVPNISSRNALTGNTPTSGTTGIRIPILDNTNVLVLNAIGDPLVGVNNFARYNYNKTLGTWLLLQIGTGATNSNVSNYQLLTNKPAVVSGVTVIAGAGLNGGGSVIGTAIAPFAAGGTINVSHADTSSLADINNSGYAYVQKLNFDTFGHVTGQTSSTWVHPSGLTQTVINTGTTYLQSITTNNGHVVSLNSSPWVHPDTSTQADSVNTLNTFIQSIYLDGAGHVTGIGTGIAAGGGGGGSPLKYNGDSGGVLTMNSGATLTISGGTNISTLRTGNAANPGLRINLNPAGASTQLQLNNAGVLGANANLTFASNILTSPNITLSSAPTVGTVGDNILVRNTGTGAIQTIVTNTIGSASNGINKLGNVYRLGGALTGNTTISGAFNIVFDNNSWSLGTRIGTIGTNSLVAGNNNTSSGFASSAFGVNSVASNTGSIAVGSSATASGSVSQAFGIGVTSSGQASFGGGEGTPTRPIISSGSWTFNYSNNNGAQTFGHGATGIWSVILGGSNHNNAGGASIVLGGETNKLNSGVRSAIIGGTTNTITAVSADGSIVMGGQTNLINDSAASLIASSYNSQINTSSNSTIINGNAIILNSVSNVVALGVNSATLTSAFNNNTVVANLAINTTPPTGAAVTDDVLVWNAADKKVKKVTQASLSGGGGTPAGSNTQIQFNNTGSFGASSNLRFTGGTTLVSNRISMLFPSSLVNDVGNLVVLDQTNRNLSTLGTYTKSIQQLDLGLNNLKFNPLPATPILLNAPDVSGPGNSAQSFVISAPNKAAGNGFGGNLILNAGYASGASGSGGTVSIIAGYATAGSGAVPGNIGIKAGDNNAFTPSNGGNVFINGGNATVVSKRGSIALFTDPAPFFNFGGGGGVLFVASTTQVPISAPTGGILLWFDGTNLRAWKAGSGSPVTII